MQRLTVAICTYNRGELLPPLIAALRRQHCPIPFDILVVDNNSSDSTQAILRQLASEQGVPLRYVREASQGITFARNRAIDECLDAEYMAFIDDDEIPDEGWLEAMCSGLCQDEADCVGGRIIVDLSGFPRPKWLSDELLGFLGELDYGGMALWIRDLSTPIWSGNVAYRMSLFKGSDLRFDARYNRAGTGVGGGEDAIMFRALIARGARIRYRPDMAIRHRVEPAKLRRRYFLRLHFLAGRKSGQYGPMTYQRTVLGVPPFMVMQVLRHVIKTLGMILTRKPAALRQAMNAAHASGLVFGRFLQRKRVNGLHD